jgi:hypothetical protein
MQLNEQEKGARLTRLATVLSVSLLVTLSACETQRQVISKREDRLSAAGFITKPANSSERQAMLARLPPNKFVMRQHGNDTHYVYADPLVCGCLYVGTQQAFNRYKANELAEHLVDEQLLTARTYSDAAWSWPAWGPPYAEWYYQRGW